MVRLEIYYDYGNFSLVKDFLENNPVVTYWETGDFTRYRHNFRIHVDDSNGFYLAYRHNSEKNNLQMCYKLVLEYNPNKVGESIYLHFLLGKLFLTLSPSRTPVLKSVDLACDTPVDISNVVVDKRHKRSVVVMDTDKGRTRYYGNRGDGRVKIYDKGAESGTGEILTRVEITKKIDLKLPMVKYLNSLDTDIPDIVFLGNHQLELDIDVNLKSNYLCVINGFMSLSEFSYRKREKIKKLIDGSMSAKIDNSCEIELIECIKTFSLQLSNDIFYHSSVDYSSKIKFPF